MFFGTLCIIRELYLETLILNLYGKLYSTRLLTFTKATDLCESVLREETSEYFLFLGNKLTCTVVEACNLIPMDPNGLRNAPL